MNLAQVLMFLSVPTAILSAGAEITTSDNNLSEASIARSNQAELSRIYAELSRVTGILKLEKENSIGALKAYLEKTKKDEKDETVMAMTRDVVNAETSYNIFKHLTTIAKEQLDNPVGTMVNALQRLGNVMLQANKHYKIPQLVELMRGMKITYMRGTEDAFPASREAEWNTRYPGAHTLPDSYLQWYLKDHLKLV